MKVIFKISPKAPFNWKLLIIRLVKAKRIKKTSQSYKYVSTSPIVRVVLLHTEGAGKTLVRVVYEVLSTSLNDRLEVK